MVMKELFEIMMQKILMRDIIIVTDAEIEFADK